MAAVFAATHRNGQRAALKILHANYVRDKSVYERFLREAYVSNKIGHPACVSVLDDDRTELDEPFLVMELLEGETLRERWLRIGRRMPIADVFPWMDAILDCLVACHSLGVIHRDLKPANVFITKHEVIKVLDFGVAQFRSENAERTASGTALGTPSYMSPEQAMGLVDQLDGRADLFSVGAIMHALIVGQRIHKARTENEALILAATTPIPSVARTAPDLPVHIVSLIDKSLAWDRRNRFQSARDMQTALRAALAELSSVKNIGAIATAVEPIASIPPAGPAGPQSLAPAQLQILTAPPPRPADLRTEHERAIQLRELFKRLERTLPSVRQFGWHHPATERGLRTAFEAIVDALRIDPYAFECSLRPYSFQVGATPVWEPAPPFDAIPYHLFASGIRNLRLKQGLTLDETRELLSLMLLEPGRDLPAEDDFATAFWEKNLAHVEYDVVDSLVEGDAAQREAFFNESDALERIASNATRTYANRLEAKAMALSVDHAALRNEKRRSPMSLDDVAKTVLSAQLDQTREKWSERYIDVLVDGILTVHESIQDFAPVLDSLHRSAADLVVAGRLQVIASFHETLLERVRVRAGDDLWPALRLDLTDALFGGETFTLMLRRLEAEPSNVPWFERLIDHFSPSQLPCALEALQRTLPASLRDALLRFVKTASEGREDEIADAALELPFEHAAPLVRILAKLDTPKSQGRLQELAANPTAPCAVEAKVLCHSSPEAAAAEISKLCDDASPAICVHAIATAMRYGLRGILPTLTRQARQPNLHEFSIDHRAILFRALMSLAPDRGEAIALEIAKKGGVFVSGERELSRIAAIDALGEFSRSSAALAALSELSQSRWGNSDEIRNAAQNAVDAIRTRTEAGDHP